MPQLQSSWRYSVMAICQGADLFRCYSTWHAGSTFGRWGLIGLNDDVAFFHAGSRKAWASTLILGGFLLFGEAHHCFTWFPRQWIGSGPGRFLRQLIPAALECVALLGCAEVAQPVEFTKHQLPISCRFLDEIHWAPY